MTVTTIQHRAAMAIPCPVCGAGVGLRCAGITATDCGHAARAHEHLSRSKPPPDAACIEALTATPGRREDARPFASWLDGRHAFRSSGRPGAALTMDVYLDGASLPGVRVRRALVDLAARHGLLVLTGTGGRGTYAVTPRGLAFAEMARSAM